MRIKIFFFVILNFIYFNVFTQITEYSPGSQKPTGEFEAYNIDSNNVASVFYENGNIKCEGKVKTGSFLGKPTIKEHGIWLYYFEDGKLQTIGHYNKGRKNGLWVYFSKTNDIINIIVYKRGKEVERKIE